MKAYLLSNQIVTKELRAGNCMLLFFARGGFALMPEARYRAMRKAPVSFGRVRSRRTASVRGRTR